MEYLFLLAIAILPLIGMAKMFAKAGQPAWAVIVPIYNIWIMIKICDKSAGFFILLLIPFVNIIFAFILNYEFVKRFGYGFGGFLLYLFFAPIMVTYMGFSKNVQYVG